MKNNATDYKLEEIKSQCLYLSFMWLFTTLLIVFNTPLFGQEQIVREAVEAFMSSGELMVFSEEYDEVFFENIKDKISSDSAKIHLESVIDQNPNSAIVYHNIGIAYLLDRNFPEASKKLKLALDKDACLVNASIGLAIIHSFNERLPKAIKYIEDAMNCHHNIPDLHYWKGMLLTAKGNFKDSLLELNKAIKAQPENYLYIYSRGYIFLKLGAERKAIEDFIHSYELNPLESENYQGTNFFKKHQIRCGFMLAYFKQHQETLTWDIRRLLEVGIGNIFRRNFTNAFARDKFKQALKLEKNHPLIYHLMGISVQGCEDKILYYDKALQLDNDIYDAHRNRGFLYLSMRNGQKALEDFEELVRLKPNLYVSYREKSRALLMQGNWEAVVKTCNKALQLDKSDNEVFFNRGKALSKMKEHQKAIEDYDYILQKTSENTAVFFEKANAHLGLKQYKEALIACDSILNVSPYSTKVQNLRGVIYMNSQKYKAALACFDQSILLAPYYSHPYFNRALTNFRFKDFVAALRDINKALKLNDQDAGAYYLRAIIKKELKQKNACKDVQKALEMGMGLGNKEVDRICE